MKTTKSSKSGHKVSRIQQLRAFRRHKPTSIIQNEDEGTKSYSCYNCQETFSQPSSLLKHNRTVHIQAKINALLVMLGLEPEEFSP